MEKCSVHYLAVRTSMIKNEQTTMNVFLKVAPLREALLEGPQDLFQKTLSSQERTAPCMLANSSSMHRVRILNLRASGKQLCN